VKAAGALALAALVALVGARYVDGGTDDAPAPDDTEPTSTPTQGVRLTEQTVPHPTEGDCHDLTAAESRRPHDSEPPIQCRKPHSTQTYYVGTFSLSIIGDRSPSTADIAEFVTPRCDRRFVRWVGGDRKSRILTRAHPVWFVPSDRDIRLGARWFRCDLVVSATDDRLTALPRNSENLLASASALDEYGQCSRGSPERSRSDAVVCSKRHSWQAFTAIRVRPGRSDGYPSRERLRDARDRCRNQARSELDFPLEWKYGWQPPTRDQWAGGLRWGLCWVPRD
jgi:hypothetical protein